MGQYFEALTITEDPLVGVGEKQDLIFLYLGKERDLVFRCK